MPCVLFASLAAGEPMGQQAYEAELLTALRAIAPVDGITIEQRIVKSWRSSLAADIRLPLSVTERAPAAIQRLAGVGAYGAAPLVHRLDLRLPPARREVVTVHDVAPLRFPDEGHLPAHVAGLLRRSRAVICPSEFAAAEVAEAFGVEGAVVIPNGVTDDARRATPLTADEIDALGVRPRFVLHAGGASQRKNLVALAAAWPAVRQSLPDLELVLCGPEDDRRTSLFATLPGTHLVGKVQRPLLLGLMATAAAVVVPSRYEGFGLPALEAMACGTPVVATDEASLPEVCGDAAMLVEPTAEGFAQGILRVVEDSALADRLRAAGRARAQKFTWERAAVMHLDVYRRAMQPGRGKIDVA